MADHADDHDIFVYMGGQVPEHLREIITHARIDESITVIDIMAFDGCPRLLHVDFHDGVERVGSWAFRNCSSLRRLHLPGVRIIGGGAFGDCVTLEDVEIGDKLETIGNGAFWRCTSLRHLKIPSIRTIEVYAFLSCTSLTDAEFGKGLETLECRAFSLCRSLRRIALPLKYGMFSFDHEADRYNQFNGCHDLATVEIVGGGEIHNIVSYLSLQSWRNEMNQEINRINQILPHSPTTEKARLIREWIQSVLDRIEHYKAEHHNLLKEATTLLELALWKAKLRQKKEEEDSLDTTKAKKAKIDVQSVRQEKRITSGADIIVKNVLPFLELP